MTLASEIGPFSGSPKLWQSPKCHGLGELLGVRCPKGQGSQASESLLSSGVSKAPVSCGDTELQMSIVGTLQPQPPGCSNSLGSSSAALQWLITTSQPGFMGPYFHSSQDWLTLAIQNKRPSSNPEHPSLAPHKRGVYYTKGILIPSSLQSRVDEDRCIRLEVWWLGPFGLDQSCNPGSDPYCLCDSGQVTSFFWALATFRTYGEGSML